MSTLASIIRKNICGELDAHCSSLEGAYESTSPLVHCAFTLLVYQILFQSLGVQHLLCSGAT